MLRGVGWGVRGERGKGKTKHGEEESFFQERVGEKGREGIPCDRLWRDSIPCIFSHPNPIVIPREYAMTLEIIPAYIVSPISVFLTLLLLPNKEASQEGFFLTFGYPMVLHRWHCSDRFSPPFMLSVELAFLPQG